MINTLFLPEIREMLALHDKAGLEEFCTALHPARTAEFMEGLNVAEAWEVLSHTDPSTRAEIFLYFERDKQVAMIETLDRQVMAHFLDDLPPDERARILTDVREEVLQEVLPLASADARRDIQRLQSYPEGTAGALMTTQVSQLGENMTKASALEQIRDWGERHELVHYLFVVDDGDHLRGVVSFRELVFAKSEQRIRELMTPNVISVRVTDDQEEVARRLAHYDLLAIPVVDNDNRLVGLITHDDVIDVLREEAAEDAQLAGGIHPLEESYLDTSILTLTWKRAIWLTILFFSGLLTTTAMSHYEEFIITLPWLVVFIPLIISCGGNSGNQSATLIITALTAGDVTLKDWKRIVRRELIMGILLGSMLAVFGLIAVFLVGYSLPAARHVLVAFVIPATLVLVVLCGTLTGSILPLLFRRLHLDPALMSNPFVAVIMDIVGIVVYMSVAQAAVRAALVMGGGTPAP